MINLSKTSLPDFEDYRHLSDISRSLQNAKTHEILNAPVISANPSPRYPRVHSKDQLVASDVGHFLWQLNFRYRTKSSGASEIALCERLS